MRRPDDVKLGDSSEYPWLPRTVGVKDIRSFTGPDQAPAVAVVGSNQGKGSLLAVQPVMASWSYRTQEEFAASLAEPLLHAQERGLLDERTVVVYPEHIGLFLYFVDEFPWITRSPSLAKAALLAALDEKAWIFLSAVLKAWERPYPEAVFAELMKLKAPHAASVYQQAFSSLASSFGVTIVAGSIPLPGPEVVEGKLLVRKGSHPLRDMANVSALFRPDGSMDPLLTHKREPVAREGVGLWMKRRPDAPIPLYPTPLGPLGVLICADAWHEGPWEAVRGAAAVAVPAFNVGPWNVPWKGYDVVEEREGLPEPNGETLPEAWRLYALDGKIAQCGAKAGVVSFLRGQIFELQATGQPLAWRKGEGIRLPPAPPPHLVKVWMPE